ncbi:MAG: argininosuccinate synthase [Nitrospinaceae bacterium]|jgi:argininosuccinate synthase|nr:argininosuccinate synthase [Nitrospinaceae bacterium]MBT3435975.1 argininosuccinate synthase [Nitrospinaceae bacterium]MBT4094825.1 argininosuccinate synthase [Nitrospinaceae bacterium]MBT5369027.1 argininosuccinate synthase [Nitrospinaceae bacterium]MBT5948251.1 argininosuccinate synthase [Nitrospinaceae bacterium]
MPSNPKKVVVAYSGGLDTSVMLKWIKEKYDCAIVAYAANVGQGDEELEGLEEKALSTGADECYVLDLQDEFASDYVFPMLRAGAVYEGSYLLGTSIARPIIAKGQMDIAKKTGADAVGHGATGKGNDQVRFELTYRAMDPRIRVIAPWREWDFGGRQQLIAYAEAHGIPVPVTAEKPYSMDRNLLHISFEGGILEDPWAEPPEDMFRLSVSPEKAPDTPAYVELGFEAGDPVSLQGEKLTPRVLMEKLNIIAGEHGVGRVDLVENRFVGMKSRGVYETPAGTVIHCARRAVESLTMDREVLHLRDSLIPKYAELVYNGFWFAPEREFLQSAIDEAAKSVTGVARIKLFKGSCQAVGRKAPEENNLYRPELATFEEDSIYSHKDAEGFIRLNALRLGVRSQEK